MSDKKLVEAISKLYPKLSKAEITSFVKNKKKKPITIASVTKVKVGVIPVKKRKKKKS
tara:strand:- start:181 stop:354 length:174 start_codon:yes stop_codon:yes gene_type:complete